MSYKSKVFKYALEISMSNKSCIACAANCFINCAVGCGFGCVHECTGTCSSNCADRCSNGVGINAMINRK